MTNLEIALESVRGQMHYAQAHLGLFEEIIKEFDELRGLILAYKDRIDPIIKVYEEAKSYRDALAANQVPVDLTPAPSLLSPQATIYGEGAETDSTTIPVIEPTASSEESKSEVESPVEEHVDTSDTPAEADKTAEVESDPAVPELKPIPDLLAASPDPVTAGPTTAE